MTLKEFDKRCLELLFYALENNGVGGVIISIDMHYPNITVDMHLSDMEHARIPNTYAHMSLNDVMTLDELKKTHEDAIEFIKTVDGRLICENLQEIHSLNYNWRCDGVPNRKEKLYDRYKETLSPDIIDKILNIELYGYRSIF